MSNFRRITQTAASVVLAMLEGQDSFGNAHYQNTLKDPQCLYLNEYQNGRERGYTITCMKPYGIKTKYTKQGNLTIIFYENRNSDHFVVKSFLGNNLWINDYKNLPKQITENWGEGDKWFDGDKLDDASDYISELINDFYTEIAV